MKFNLVFSLTIGLFVLGTFAAPEKSRSEIFDDDFPEEVYDTKIEFTEISARIRSELESVEKFIEENEDFKAGLAERVKRAEHDVYGSRVLSSLNGDYWRHPKSKDLKTVAQNL